MKRNAQTMGPGRTLTHQAGNIVWKVYDKDLCAAKFSDFGVRDYDGKTIFYRSMYLGLPTSGEEFKKLRRDQAAGKPDPVAKSMAQAKALIEAYVKTRALTSGTLNILLNVAGPPGRYRSDTDAPNPHDFLKTH